MPNQEKRRPERVFLAMVLIALIIALSLYIIFSSDSGGDENEEFDHKWGDLSRFKESINDVPIFDYDEIKGPLELASLNDPRSTVYLLIGIEKEINSSEYVSIRDFILAGGQVIVADDGTNANRLGDIPQVNGLGRVNYTGYPYIVAPRLGQEELGYEYNKTFIKAQSWVQGSTYDVIAHSPMGLNHSGGGFSNLKCIMELTVIDLNENWEMDLEDKYTPYGAIGIRFLLGENGGSILYLSTTGIFTDNIYNSWENEDFVKKYIFTSLPEGGGDVLLDSSKQVSENSPHTLILPR